MSGLGRSAPADGHVVRPRFGARVEIGKTVELLVVILAGAGTALATGVGAIPVFLLGPRAERLRPLLVGAAAVVMMVACVTLLSPALRDGSGSVVAVGLALGAALLLAARHRLSHRGRFAAEDSADARRSLLVFGVLFVHSFPEGLAVGAAWAAHTAALGPFVAVAIALQNVPEGTAVAIPSSAARKMNALSTRLHAVSATTLPSPASSTIISRSSESAVSL